MSNIIQQRVDAMRDAMRREGVHAFILPSSDPHCGEYVPARWQAREWISGFNGSAGTAVVTLDDAALWTDSRYFIAAAQQLAGTPFTLMRDGQAGTPSIAQWLAAQLPTDAVVAVDGWTWDYATLAALRTVLPQTLRTDLDLVKEVWTERPDIPLSPIEVQPVEFSGEPSSSKLTRIRKIMAEAGADELLLCALDDIAWLANIRAVDVHCTPLAVAYMVVDERCAILFTDRRKLSDEVCETLEAEGILVAPYDEVGTQSERVMLSRSACNYALVETIEQGGAVIIDANPVAELKAVKNDIEIAGMRNAMRRDGVALVKATRWLKEEALNAGSCSSEACSSESCSSESCSSESCSSESCEPASSPQCEPVTELTVDERFTAERAKQEHFRGLSFDTIAGYADHGAIVHYEATSESAHTLAAKGLLLLDSGAQYQDGTTDITRTIPLGPLTEQERRDYTLVLKGHIALAMLRFPEGVAGTRLDAFARYAMWQEGIDYGHGTGHGVGSYLSVHEGPHQIRPSWKPFGLRPGMTVTDEPGIYREGSHGVRIENTMLVVADGETEFGRFCRLEPLTLCPIDREPIERDLLSGREIAWLNDYHRRVYDELSPLLEGEDLAFLNRATQPI